MFTHGTSPSWLIVELFRAILAGNFDDGGEVSQPGLRVKRVTTYGGPWFTPSRKFEGQEELMSKLVRIGGGGFKSVSVYLAPEGLDPSDLYGQTNTKFLGQDEAFLACIGTDSDGPEDMPCIVLVLNGELAV